jgi:hypothetical protein
MDKSDKTSFKNLLQEWCMHQGFALPVYNTTIAGGTGHSPKFKCIVRVADREYILNDNGSRKEIELRCAQMALADLRGNPSARTTPVVRSSPRVSPTLSTSVPTSAPPSRSISSSISNPALSSSLTGIQVPQTMPPPLSLAPRISVSHSPLIPGIIVLVDLDNCDLPISLVQSNIAMFHIFVSKNSTKNFTQYRSMDNCVVYLAPTTVKDASDTVMIYEARGLRERYVQAKFLIFTRDHFGETLSLLVHGEYICHFADLERVILENS